MALPLRIRSDYRPRAALADEMRVSIAPNWRRKGIGKGETCPLTLSNPRFKTLSSPLAQFLRLPTRASNGTRNEAHPSPRLGQATPSQARIGFSATMDGERFRRLGDGISNFIYPAHVVLFIFTFIPGDGREVS